MNPLSHPGGYQIPENDIEKQGELKDASINVTPSGSDPGEQHDIPPTPRILKGRLTRWNNKMEGLGGLEARGITRVLPEEKHDMGVMGYLQMFSLWFSISLVATTVVTGLLGPLLFNLGWVDCVCCVIFANALSCCGTAYTATFGPQSGNRTMILGRYFMGYWPSKIICVFNIFNQVGWGIIGSIVAGQTFSAVNGAGLSIAVGCVISALCIGIIAIFGIGILHSFERYAWIPQMFAFLVLIGSAGRNFDTSFTSIGPAGTITANRCSFFALQYSISIGFSCAGADFYVYYHNTTSKRLTFLMTWSGMWIPLVFTNILGVGIATGVPTNPSWNEAYNTSSGALLLACYDGLGGFGSLCVVILALGSIANNAPGTYAAALSFQVLGRYGTAIPRWMWSFLVMVVELVCSVAGRDHLYSIFENLLPLTSYYVSPWVIIVLEEHLLFHVLCRVPFDWTAWEDKKRLPLGIAALLAYLIGWAGAILGMYQVWYQGVIAVKIGNYGSDIGAWLSVAFASLTYPPLRYIELKVVGR
ncbi:MAG: hypothetical protein Q9225_001391 [Loekoesia sp. 1 TL-2023]